MLERISDQNVFQETYHTNLSEMIKEALVVQGTKNMDKKHKRYGILDKKTSTLELP